MMKLSTINCLKNTWTCILAITIASIAPNCFAQQSPDSKINSVAPETCLSWFQWSNPYKADTNSLNAVDRMMAEPDVSQFLKNFVDKLGLLPAILVPDEAPPAIKKAAATLGPHIVDAIIRKQGCFFVESFDLNEDQEPRNLKVGLALKIGDDVDQTLDAINQLLAVVRAPMETVDLGGQSVLKIQAPPNGPFDEAAISVKGDYLLAATSLEVLRDMQNRMQAGKNSAWLQKLHSSQSYVRTAMVGIIDISQLKEPFLPLMGAEANKAIQALGFGNLERLEFSGGYAKTDFEQRFSLKFDGPPRGIFDALGTDGLTLNDIAHFPEDAFFGMAMSLDGKKAMNQFQKTLIQLDPNSAQEVASGMIKFQSQTGIDIRGLIENLGPTFTLHNGFGDGIISGLMLKANVEDPQGFEATIDEIVAMTQKNMQLDFRLDLESIEQNGKTVKSLRFGGVPVPVEPSWLIEDGSVTISLFPSVLASATNRELVTPLVKSGSFQPYAKLLETDGQVVGFAYSETKLSYEMLYGYACMMSAMGKNMMSGTGDDRITLPLSDRQLAEIGKHLQDLQLPSCRSIVAHLTPQVAVIRKEKDAIVLESHSSIASSNVTMFAPGVAIGMLLPAVQQVRAAARRTQSMNNLRQCALAALNHESAHMHFPSGNGPVKKGGPPVSWRVKILPFIEQAHLYDQYDFDQPWDSANNMKVLEQMPPVFQNPASNAQPNHTVYRGVGGTSGIMGVDKEGESRETKFELITDGASNTILFLEVSDTMAVPWTKPDGGIDPKEIEPWALSGNHPGGFNAAFGDGSTHFISDSIDNETFKNLLQMNDGNVVRGF